MSQTELIALIIPGFFLCFGLFWSAVVFLSSRLSGWGTLARHYPGTAPQGGRSWHWTSATFSWFASYRNILTVNVSPAGLFLRPVLIFRPGHEALLIPWNAITNGRRTNLFFTEAFRLEVIVPGAVNTKPITFYGKALADALEARVGK